MFILLTYFSDLNLCFQGCCHFLFIQKAALNDLFLLLFKQQQQQKKDRRSKICNCFMWVLLKKKRLFQGGLIIDLNIS